MTIYESLRQLYIQMFQENPEKVLPTLCKLTLPHKVFLAAYENLTPIEAFQPEEKREWKLFVHELFPNESIQFKLDAVKIIYTIGQLTN